jgi:hypothetical protein
LHSHKVPDDRHSTSHLEATSASFVLGVFGELRMNGVLKSPLVESASLRPTAKHQECHPYIRLFKQLSLDLPEGSIIHADKGYTDYHYEDLPKEVGLHLKAQRKKRSKRPMVAWEEFLSKPARQYIETVFSNLSAMFSRKIHAVTPRGFELKIVCFLLAFSIQCL